MMPWTRYAVTEITTKKEQAGEKTPKVIVHARSQGGEGEKGKAGQNRKDEGWRRDSAKIDGERRVVQLDGQAL